MNRVTVVSPSPKFAERLDGIYNGTLAEPVTTWWDRDLVTEPEMATQLISDSDPTLVVLGPYIEQEDALAIAKDFSRARPEVTLVLVGENDSKLFAPAMRAGVRDIISDEASDLEIEEQISAALNISEQLLARRPSEDDASGTVISIVAPKGGSGKTSVLANLAVLLSQKYPGDVVVVDLDIQFGDLSDALLIEPSYSMADAMNVTGKLDLTVLKALLTRRKDLFILAAPTNPAEADEISTDLVLEVITTLATGFQWVLVDTAGGLSDLTLSVIEQSSDLLLLTSMDILGVRAMKKTINILDRLDLRSADRHMVINRSNSRVGLDTAEVQRELGVRRAFEIPSSRQVPLSLNRGEPFVEVQPRSALSKRVVDIAQDLMEVREKREAQRNKWGNS
jgi:pilus assembly protein CpaE